MIGGTLCRPGAGGGGFAVGPSFRSGSGDVSIRVVVADDQEIVRDGIRRAPPPSPTSKSSAAADGERPSASAATSARRRADGRPHAWPRRHRGHPAARERQRTPRVLMLTTFDLDEYVYDALGAGASGFLLKDVTAQHLFEAVAIVNAGEALLAPTVTRRLIDEFARLRPQLPVDLSGSASSRRARPRCCGSSPRASPTPRSPSAWSSPRRRSRRTSAASSGSSTFATGVRPSSSLRDRARRPPRRLSLLGLLT